MRKASVIVHNVKAGILVEESKQRYSFQYHKDYNGSPVSLTMPVREAPYLFDEFPPFFDGLLPEGVQLDGLLKKYKIDRTDYFKQLIISGSDLVGAVTVMEMKEPNE